jgi:hypothetical protein
MHLNIRQSNLNLSNWFREKALRRAVEQNMHQHHIFEYTQTAEEHSNEFQQIKRYQNSGMRVLAPFEAEHAVIGIRASIVLY